MMRRGFWWSALPLLLATGACAHHGGAGRMPEEPLEGWPDEDAEVIVSSIDPPLPIPGPAMREARIALARARSREQRLAGLVGLALTGDEAAPEVLLQHLADPESCEVAASALAFLPRSLAVRPLWLALRLECAAPIAAMAATALDLEGLVEAARREGELPEAVPEPAPADRQEAPGSDSCEAVAATLREAASSGRPLPASLDSLRHQAWALPESDAQVCSPEAQSAALRLRSGDATVRLALDLRLGSPETLPPYLARYIDRFGLGAASPRLADRVGEGEGLICRAMIRAGRLDDVLPILAEHPEQVPRCLPMAVERLRGRDDDAALAALEGVARAVQTEGCAASALSAALLLVERGVAPPGWTRDPATLGRAVADTLLRTSSSPHFDAATLARLRHLARDLIHADDPAPSEGPVRLYQRDIERLLPALSGSRRAMFRQLLEQGWR